jgi:hypothetical protein
MATPEEGMASMIRNLAEKTGKTLEQWIAIAKKSKLQKHGEIVKMLKADHGLSHGYANLVALRTLQAASSGAGGGGSAGGSEPPDGGALVDAQYAGTKAGMRPVYEAIVATVKKFGKDVVVSPKKTYVSLRRNKQFALIQPASSRVDVGINLPGTKPTDRLEASGSFNAMMSHRVRVASKSEIDAQLLGWLRDAYSAA